ncbi:MAG: permease [Verrucomicrobiota bacterium]
MQDFVTSFAAILLEGVPFLLFGALISGFIHSIAKPRFFQSLRFTHRATGIGSGIFAGILLPLCECSSILIVRRLVQKGVPLYAAMTYFLSGAILNPITLFTTWIAFQNRNPVEMIVGRFIGGLILVIGIGYWLSRHSVSDLFRPQSDQELPECEHPGGWWKNMLLVAKHDFITVSSYFVIGAAIAAWANTYLSWWKIAPWMENAWLSPLLTIFIAQGMSLCSTVDAFIIAPMGQIPTHAKLAFLVAGPIFDFKLMMMYSMIFKTRVIVKLWLIITTGTLLLSWIYLWIRPWIAL